MAQKKKYKGKGKKHTVNTREYPYQKTVSYGRKTDSILVRSVTGAQGRSFQNYLADKLDDVILNPGHAKNQIVIHAKTADALIVAERVFERIKVDHNAAHLDRVIAQVHTDYDEGQFAEEIERHSETYRAEREAHNLTRLDSKQHAAARMLFGKRYSGQSFTELVEQHIPGISIELVDSKSETTDDPTLSLSIYGRKGKDKKVGSLSTALLVLISDLAKVGAQSPAAKELCSSKMLAEYYLKLAQKDIQPASQIISGNDASVRAQAIIDKVKAHEEAAPKEDPSQGFKEAARKRAFIYTPMTKKDPTSGEQIPVAAHVQVRDAFDDPSIKALFLCGFPGTGKTYAAYKLAIHAVATNRADRIIMVSPMQAADGRDIGAVPGDEIAKAMPYMRPHLQKLRAILGPNEADNWLTQGKAIVQPISTERGAEWENAIAIVSEAQNLNPTLLKLALTRLNNSRLILDGDPGQYDTRKGRSTEPGLLTWMRRLDDKVGFASITFDRDAIVRDPIIDTVVCAEMEDLGYDPESKADQANFIFGRVSIAKQAELAAQKDAPSTPSEDDPLAKLNGLQRLRREAAKRKLASDGATKLG